MDKDAFGALRLWLYNPAASWSARQMSLPFFVSVLSLGLGYSPSLSTGRVACKCVCVSVRGLVNKLVLFCVWCVSFEWAVVW